ncbi:MAG: permease-like cell division protein FtsX [Prevotella sp.]|jgi:cell division transport system permease protein|nr:permease-like cell division protein FtsX [Prevotella sp.]MBQ5548372.1 permease-like cell division protein FtsX [Prevotella sp.]
MSNKKKRPRSRRGMQAVTLCISTTMVLILLGLVVFFVLSARNLSAHMKENLTVTVMLKDSVTVNDAKLFCRSLYHRPYSRNIDYISQEEAQREQVKELGSDPTEFLGFNPFPATLEIQLKADYANRDSLKWITKEIKKDNRVSDIAYMEDLMNRVNANLSRVSIILLVLAVLLTFVSFSLISNTVRLSVYARRFVIHTMKLVGASWGFIRRPFLKQAVGVGIIAAILANGVLGAGVYGLYLTQPGVSDIVTWEVLAVTAASVLLFGIVITMLCAWLAVNKFLRMKAGELYKI